MLLRGVYGYYARLVFLILPGKALEGCNLPDDIGTRFAMRRAISYIRMCKRYKLPATRMYSDVVTIIKKHKFLKLLAIRHKPFSSIGRQSLRRSDHIYKYKGFFLNFN